MNISKVNLLRYAQFKYFILIIFFFYTLDSSYGFIVNMDFEKGTKGTKAMNNSCKINGGDIFNSDANATFFTDEESYGPGQSIELNINKGTAGFGSWGGIYNYELCKGVLLKKGDEIWVRVRTKFPVGFDYTGGPHLKFLRVHTIKSATDNSNKGYDDIYIDPIPNKPSRPTPFKFIKEFTGTYTNKWRRFGVPGKDTITLGKWVTYEYYFKFDDLPLDFGGQAVVRFWKDGILIGEATDEATLSEAGNVSEAFLLFTYWNGSSPATQKMYVDDLTIIASPDKPTDTDDFGNKYIGTGNKIIPGPPTITILP